MARAALTIAGGVIGGAIGGPRGAFLGIAVGSTIGSLIDPPSVPGPKLGEQPVQTSRAGVPIPVGWGLVATHGNIIQEGPQVVTKEKQGGKGGPTFTVKRVNQTFAIGICRSIEGPIAGIMRIWENGKLVVDNWPNPEIPIEETNAFLAGVRLYLGGEDQLPDPDLEAIEGVGNQPYYRGLPYMVFVNKDLTDFARSIPQYLFEVMTGADFTVTSRPYPLELIEGIQQDVLLTDFLPQISLTEGVDQTAAITSITLSGSLVSQDYEIEGIDQTAAITGITLSGSLVTQNYETEGIDQTAAITSITLSGSLIEYTYETEGIDQTAAITSITLT